MIKLLRWDAKEAKRGLAPLLPAIVKERRGRASDGAQMPTCDPTFIAYAAGI